MVHASPELEYVGIYKKITSASHNLKQGRDDISQQLFEESLDEILAFKARHDSWNPGIINFRVDFIRQNLKELGSPKATNKTSTSSSNSGMDVVQKVENAKDKLDGDRQILNHMKSRVQSLESEKRKLEQKLREALTAAPEKVDPAVIEEARKQIRDLTIENQLLQVQLAESVKKAAEIKPMDNLEQKIQELSDQITILTMEKQGLLLEIKRLKNQKSSDGFELIPTPEEQDQINTLTATVGLVDSQLEELQNEILVSTDRADRLQKELDSISLINETLTQSNISLENQVRTLESKLADLDNLDHYQNHIQALEGSLETKDKEIRRLSEENNILLTKNSDLQETVENLSSINIELTNLVEEKNNQIEQDRSDYEKSLNYYKDELSKIKELNEELAGSLSPTSIADQETLKELENSYAQVQNEVNLLKSQNSRLEDENQLLKKWLAEATVNNRDQTKPSPTQGLTQAQPQPSLPDNNIVKSVPQPSENNVKSNSSNYEHIPPERLKLILEKEKELQKLLEDDPKNLENRNKMTQLLIDKGDYNKARIFVNETIKNNPKASKPLIMKGILEWLSNEYKSAVAALAKAIELDPKNPDAHMYLGTVLSELGYRKAAEESLRRAVRLDPKNPFSHFNLSVAYISQDPPYRALANHHYQKAVQLGHPRNSEIELRIQREP